MTHTTRASYGPGRRLARVAIAGLASTALGTALSVAFVTPAQASAPAQHSSLALTMGARTAAPVGKLAPAGCSQGSGTASCDLYARNGAATVLGTPINVWSFTTGAADPLRPVGPNLVVRQNDVVSITVHNALDPVLGQSVSLALPGQAAADLAGSATTDTVGVASGASKTYTVTAHRPGTFVYEAGHTANGNRQVAMGLAGALVVLPADGTAYGSAGSAYADDAVLVLSEIDPALNANPTTFDLRNFAPRYRLINGKPYPAADPIPTAENDRVLLRYVNTGAQMHAMSVLGTSQTEIAQDGHPMAYPLTVTAESIDPGQTLDTVVTMPAGPGGKVAVYEPAEHLDNNGQKTADPQQFAFGGMLTFLDTNAPAPSTDGVGPVASHVAASPNPSDGLSAVTVTADLSDAHTGGSTVSQAEFVVDDAASTGPGFGVPMTATFGTVEVTGAHGTIPATASVPCSTVPQPVALNCLDSGKHTVFVRALDSAGNWGVVGSVIFNLPKTGPQTTNGSIVDSPASGKVPVTISTTGDDSAAGGSITASEYFIDTVGANGSGTPLTDNRVATVVSEDADIPATVLAALPEGLHHVLVHSKDSLGLWGPPLDVPLPIDLTGPAVDAGAVGPNPTNGILSDQGNTGYLKVSAQITDRDAGNALQSNVVDAEAFLDPTGTPAGGTGLQLIAVDGSMNSTSEAVYGLIPLSQVKSLTDGTHHVYVRGQDAAGNWGPMFGINLTVDKTAPVLGALTVTPNPTNGAATVVLSAPVTDASLISAAEFWTGTVDPGAGHGSSVPVSVVAGKITVTVPMAAIASGVQQFNLRVADLAGNWSKPISTSVTVTKPNAIFADTFESGTAGAWSASTGAVSVTAAAALQASTRGLQVSLPGTRANQPSYLTDGTPASETAYHARFAFNANTLNSGSATALTIFQAQNAANGQAFAVQYRLSAGSLQVRLVLDRSGAAAVTGAWVTLTTGTHVLQVDWAAATAGSLKLTIDGTAGTPLTGNTSTLRVDTVLLGVSAGYSNNSAGIAYFDNFASARVSLP